MLTPSKAQVSTPRSYLFIFLFFNILLNYSGLSYITGPSRWFSIFSKPLDSISGSWSPSAATPLSCFLVTLDRSRSSLQLSLSSELLGSLSSILNLLELLSVVLRQLLVALTVSQIVLGCFSILSEVPVQIQPHLR